MLLKYFDQGIPLWRILTQVTIKNTMRRKLHSFQFHISLNTQYIKRYRIKIQIQVFSSTSVFNGFTFSLIP